MPCIKLADMLTKKKLQMFEILNRRLSFQMNTAHFIVAILKFCCKNMCFQQCCAQFWKKMPFYQFGYAISVWTENVMIFVMWRIQRKLNWFFSRLIINFERSNFALNILCVVASRAITFEISNLWPRSSVQKSSEKYKYTIYKVYVMKFNTLTI